jgi:hypothetical protein
MRSQLRQIKKPKMTAIGMSKPASNRVIKVRVAVLILNGLTSCSGRKTLFSQKVIAFSNVAATGDYNDSRFLFSVTIERNVR